MALKTDSSFDAIVLVRGDSRNYLINHGFPLGESTLEYWATKGIGPKFRIVNGRAVYRKADLDAWMREASEPAAA